MVLILQELIDVDEGILAAATAGLAAQWDGRQAIVVRALDDEPSKGWMWLLECADGEWKAAADPWPAVLGRNGTAKRMEGDGRSPSGVFMLGSAFGWREMPGGCRYPYQKLDVGDRWVDDPASTYYNRWVRGPEAACGGGEELAAIRQYSHAVSVRYNDDAVRGRGSAIFLHAWEGPEKPTSGCTAIAGEHMEYLLLWLDAEARPLLVQGAGGQIARLMREQWNLLCLPAGWGFVDDVIPDAQLEIRYHTPDNFTGKKLPGYGAPQAVMRLEAIEALAGASREFRAMGLGIRVYDAYRPQRSTDAMIAWAEDPADTATKAEYYPGIEKADIPGRYVARRSAHRLGGTVDLTLLDWETGQNLDMGGPFDYFGGLSAFGHDGLANGQKANRKLLRDLMTRHGFVPYDAEWWHFTYPVGGDGGSFDLNPRGYSLDG